MGLRTLRGLTGGIGLPAGLCLALCLGTPGMAWAYSDEQLATAIWYSEGGAKTAHPYGILSVKVSGAEEARRVCLNTIRNNRVRWQKAGAKGDYLEFLANRYCPVGAENDNGTNKYWLRNVRYYLSRMEA